MICVFFALLKIVNISLNRSPVFGVVPDPKHTPLTDIL
jgi:hypothetical protein